MITKLEKTIIRELQAGLPLVPRPFAELGAKVGLTEEQTLAKVNELIDKGYMRRIGAALRHRQVGYVANAMIVWLVPDERVDEVGNEFAHRPEVTHCYQRKKLPQWPYNFYTMIHSQSKDECYNIAADMAKSVGIDDYQLLFSTKELKKSSMRYFMEEENI
ncbi:Lrp/AsnC family transcriptional regulator [Peptococcaceae bacterium 1198_IL3148]